MNLFEIAAKLTLNSSEFDSGLKSAGKKIGGFVGGAVKAGTAAIGAAATAVGAIVKQSVDAYGQFEQLRGGAQKIFDGMDFSKVMRDANDAYKQLNMSASQYLEAINLAGATFSQTMGAEKGYDTARKGMIAIADFASGTGKNIEELNTKFQMITRAASSYQSIADQFAGILPQTSADFLAQAQAAGLLAKKYEKLTEVPVSEYQQAVTEMIVKGVGALGLAKNTAMESEKTLTGSFAMTKAAWQNLVTAFADPDADLGMYIDRFVESAGASLGNLIPTIEQALKGVGTAAEKMVPALIETFNSLAKDTLPALLNSALVLLDGLGNALLDNAETLLDDVLKLVTNVLDRITDGKVISKIAKVAFKIVSTLSEWLSNNTGTLISATFGLIEAVGSAFLSNVDVLIQDLLDVMLAVASHITDAKVMTSVVHGVVSLITSMANWLGEYSGVLIDAAIQMVLQIVMALTDPQALVGIVDSALVLILSLVDGLIQALPTLIEAAPVIIQNLVTAIVDALPLLIDAALQLVEMLAGAIMDNFGAINSAAYQIIFALINGIITMLPELIPLAFQIIMTILTALTEHLPEFISGGIDMVMALISGLVSMTDTMLGAGIELVFNLIDAIIDAAKGLIDAGRQMVEKVKSGFKQKIEDAKNWGRDLIQNFIGGIQEKWNALKEKVAGVANTVKSFLGFSEPEEGPLSDFHTYAPDMMDLFAKGIRDNTDVVRNQLAESFAFDDLMHPELTVTHNSGSGGESQETILADLRDVLNRLQAIEPGTLVGMIAPDMDAALGDRQMIARRRLA